MPALHVQDPDRTEARDAMSGGAAGDASSSGAPGRGEGGGVVEGKCPSPLPIESLTIEGYRSIRKLEIKGLGRVNLLTGRNDSGKTSVLEALRILASDATWEDIQEILKQREETEFKVRRVEGEPPPAMRMAPLFHGFPDPLLPCDPIRLAASGGLAPNRLSLEFRIVRHAAEAGERLDLFAITPDRERTVEWRPRLLTGGHPYPCAFLGPFSARETATMAQYWDAIVLTPMEGEVVNALRLVQPELQGVAMIGSGSDRIAMVRSSRFPRPVPLRSFGDGMNRLFGLALSMVSVKEGGLVLIDEFENGMHYTVQLDAWRMIFRLAARLGVQVFATTHSWDAVEAFQAAAAESPESGVLIRLSRNGSDMFARGFDEEDLGVIARNRIEAR